MGVGLAIAGVIASAAGAAASVYSANKQASAQKSAAKKAEQSAALQLEQEKQDMRRQNAKSADITSILQAAQDSSASGGSTLLSGAGGVSDSQLSIGKTNTLG